MHAREDIRECILRVVQIHGLKLAQVLVEGAANTNASAGAGANAGTGGRPAAVVTAELEQAQLDLSDGLQQLQQAHEEQQSALEAAVDAHIIAGGEGD